MANSDVPTITVITATYNASALLSGLIESMVVQTDQDFEWVVADGGSTDETLEMLERAKSRLKNVIIDSRPDKGIYDALNRAVTRSKGDYYIVVGADDTLLPDAVRQYRKVCAETNADFVSAKVISNDGMARGVRTQAWEWLYGAFAYVSGHAVGLAIRRSLHDQWGLYSPKFAIAADQHFILCAIHGGAKVARTDFTAGRFEAIEGTSGQDAVSTLLESYRVQIELGGSFWLQTLLLCIRLIRNRNSRFSKSSLKKAQFH